MRLERRTIYVAAAVLFAIVALGIFLRSGGDGAPEAGDSSVQVDAAEADAIAAQEAADRAAEAEANAAQEAAEADAAAAQEAADRAAEAEAEAAQAAADAEAAAAAAEADRLAKQGAGATTVTTAP
jgi:hypothetical protein